MSHSCRRAVQPSAPLPPMHRAHHDHPSQPWTNLLFLILADFLKTYPDIALRPVNVARLPRFSRIAAKARLR